MVIVQTCVRSVATVWTDVGSVGTVWTYVSTYFVLCGPIPRSSSVTTKRTDFAGS